MGILDHTDSNKYMCLDGRYHMLIYMYGRIPKENNSTII